MIFPDNPELGQEFKPSDNHPTYLWIGHAWRAISANISNSGNSFFYQDVPPTDNIHNGTMWFNTENSNIYVYAHDGESFTWLQINA